MIDWESVDWDDLTPRLLAYAAFGLRRAKMDQKLAPDIVKRAVVRVLANVRAPGWARSEFVAIAGVIDDEINKARK